MAYFFELGQQPPMGHGGYGQQQPQQQQQQPMGYGGYGQQQSPNPMQTGPCGGGQLQQQQQQYPSWAQSTVAPWSPSSEQAQRSASATGANSQASPAQNYNPRPDGQALTDSQRAAQSMRDEAAGRSSSSSSTSGTVEERRAQKIREAQDSFRNAARRDRFEAGNVGDVPTIYAADYGIGGGGGGGGRSMSGGGFNQQIDVDDAASDGYRLDE